MIQHVLEWISPVHVLPVWFLVFALLLPRIALLVYAVQSGFHPAHWRGWLSVAAGVLVPRLLVLWLIYFDQGIGFWFVLHAVTLIVVWVASGNAKSGSGPG